MRKHAFLMFTILSLTLFAVAQEKQRPSPPASAQCKFADGKSIRVDYSSPRANEATTFVSDANLSIGGKDIPAGSYTIFTVPNQNKWLLIVNKKNAEWGIPYKYEGDELGRFDMSISKTSGPVENFTISFHEMGNGCHMYLDWENTRATIEISEKQ